MASEIATQTLFRSRAKIRCPGVCVIAVPNAAKRSQWAAQRAKREGMQTGFPDLLCLAPGRVAFIEFKSDKGRLSNAQSEWHERLSGMGFPSAVFRDADAALDWLRENGFPFVDERRAA